MTELLIFLVIVVLSLGALFLWVARTRSSSVSGEITDSSPSHEMWTRPDRCLDFCRQDSSGDVTGCAMACSLLQD
ncbi:MAG: hypothetical protein RDU20_09500 [Desulfomonilaceae bacterium]|nr:hypothetical protein [Desulfomonilaceae bacterium]